MSEPIALGAILTGGKARRMGGEKATALFRGKPLVEHVFDRISPLVGETVCIGIDVGLNVPTIPDLFPGMDSLGGIATALGYAKEKFGQEALVLVTGCDMPLISPVLVKGLADMAKGHGIVVVHSGKGYEPLLALYRGSVFEAAKEQILGGRLRINDLFDLVNTLEVSSEVARGLDPELISFANVNRPEDLLRLAEAFEKSRIS